MNGVNEVQSSSMVQRIDPVTNEVMSSTMLQSTSDEQERIATIMEDVNEGEFQPMASSPITLPQIICNRVLSEIPVSATNTPMSININKISNENPPRASGIQHEQVGEIFLLFHEIVA